jgi:uncharacterized membrane protein
VFESPQEPSYDPGGSGYYGPEPQTGMAMPQVDIKKFLPIIIAVIVVLVVGFLALSWMNSQQEVTIKLIDPDGSVEGRIILKDAQSKPITEIDPPKGASTEFKTKLWPGEYKVEAFSEGYKKEMKTFKVPLSNKEFEVELERDLTATITATFDYTKLYNGQKLSGKVSVLNTGNEFNIEDLKPQAAAPLEVLITSVAAGPLRSGGSIYLDFEAKLKEGAKLTAPQQANIEFRILGSQVKSNKLTFQIMPTINATEVTFPTSVTKTKMEAGKEETIDIKVKNNNKTIPIENLTLEIIPDADSTDNIEWFRFSGSTDEKYKVLLPTIEPTKEVLVKLYVRAPASAKINDFFKGTLKGTSYSINAEKTSTMDFKVTIEKDVGLTFTATGNPFTVTCKKSTSSCEEKVYSNKEFKIKNVGDVDITDLTIEPDYTNTATSANCLQYLNEFTVIDSPDGSKISVIEPNEEKDIKVILTAPFEGLEKETATCIIKWMYVDPLDPTQTVKETYSLEINKTTTS